MCFNLSFILCLKITKNNFDKVVIRLERIFKEAELEEKKRKGADLMGVVKEIVDQSYQQKYYYTDKRICQSATVEMRRA